VDASTVIPKGGITMPRITPFYTPEERIKRMVEVNERGCWNWMGSKRNGYGRLVIGSRATGSRKFVSAHRYSYQTFVEPIPDKLMVCHKCDNPSCVNPDHLFVGNRQDNVNDRELKGRNNHFVGEKSPTSKLTAEKVTEIRKLIASGVGVTDIADIYGVHYSTISEIRDGKAWKHIPEPPKETI
jgi:hypothetical protein